MIPLDTAVTWLSPCLLAGPAHALLPAAKKGGGFDVVRYRRRVRGAAWLLRWLSWLPSASRGGRGWLVLFWSVFGLGNKTRLLCAKPPGTTQPAHLTKPHPRTQPPPGRGPQRSRGTIRRPTACGRERGRSTCEDGPSRERRWQGRAPATLAAASVCLQTSANDPFTTGRTCTPRGGSDIPHQHASG